MEIYVLVLVTSRNIPPHQNSYIYFHIQPITYKDSNCNSINFVDWYYCVCYILYHLNVVQQYSL